MTVSEVFRALGRTRFDELVKSISMGSLRRYEVYESFKIHTRLHKLNRERLRRAAPQFWTRLEENDDALAKELAQGMLVSHLSLVAEALDFLEIPHDGNGFYEKDASAAEKLTDGWQQRLFDHLKDRYPEPLILLYINHLDWELGKASKPFLVNH